MSETATATAISKKDPDRSVGMNINRIAIILACAAVVWPELNPGRITTQISQYTSLLTASFSYDALVGNLSRALKKGYVDEATFHPLMVCCLLVLVGAILAAVGGAMSLGNKRMRWNGIFFPIGGSVLMLGGCAGIFAAYTQIVAADTKKAPAMLPIGLIFYAVMGAVILVTSIMGFFHNRAFKDELEPTMKMTEKYKLFLMFIPIIALVFIFCYLPLWGWRYAFFDYTVGSELTWDNFVGFKWFTYLFQSEATRNDLVRVIKNTLGISGINIITTWLPMIFAIFLTQIESKRFRRIVQTFTTVPNFLGWVIVYAVALAIFSTDGFINNFLNNILGIASNTNYLMDSSHMWLKMWLWGTWKGLGWSAIIYISSITSIDPGLYEAATMDGAGRFQKIWNVTIPQLMPTFFVLLLMSVAGVLSNGLDQYLVFSNPTNMSYIEVLDLYVYNLGIGNGQIPLSTVVGMFKSVVSVVLLFAANSFSKATRGESII